MSAPCASCGRHVFPEPGRVCWWCNNSTEGREERIRAGISAHEQAPARKLTREEEFEAERIRLRKRYQKRRKK